MSNTITRKILRDISARRMRTFLVSASIMIGVLGVIALFSTRDLINQQLEEDIQPTQLPMIDLYVSLPDEAAPDNDTLLATLNRANEAGQSLEALAGIERVEGLAYYPIGFKTPGERVFNNAELRTYSLPLAEVQIEPMRLVEGAWAQPGQNQVVVETRFASANDFTIGEEIIFRSADGGEQTYTITGLVFHPYSFSGVTGDIPGPDEGIYMEYPDAQALLNLNGMNRFVARYETFEQALAQFEPLQTTLTSLSPYIITLPTYEDPAENRQVVAAEIYNNVLTALAIMTMIVSGFLVINVINTITAEQRRQIGAMKAIGATTQSSFMIYAGMAFVYGVIGTLVAIIPGVLVGYLITSILAPQLDILYEGFGWSPNAVLIGLLLGLIVPVLAALIPVYNGTRIRIIEAMTDLGISGKYGESRVERLLGGLPLPISAKQAVTNVYQKGRGLTLTIITLTLTVATFMSTVAITVALTRELDNLFSRLAYQITVMPNEIQEQERMETLLSESAGVAKVSPAALVWVRLDESYVNFFTGNNQIQVFGLEPAANSIELDLTDGTGWSEDPTLDGFVPSSAVAGQLDLEAGDEITLTVGGQTVTRRVLGVDSNAFDAANMRWQDLSALAGLRSGAVRPNEYSVAGTVDDIAINALGMEENLLAFLGATRTAADEPGVFISRTLADQANLTAGDEITVTVEGQTVTREVMQVVANELLRTQAAQLAPGLTTLPDDLVLFSFPDLVSVTGVDTTGEPVPNSYYVTVTGDTEDPAHVDQVIEDIKAVLLANEIPATFVNQVSNANKFKQQVGTNTSIIFAAAVLIAAVGAIGLLTTLSIAVLERQKEIGVMRSLGASSLTVATQFVIEGLLVGLVAWIIGVPLSYVMALGLYDVFQLSNIPFTYPLEGLVMGLVGILAVAAVSSFGPSMNAAGKTVSEILRYQ